MEDENTDLMEHQSFTPTWENMDQSPIIENASVQVYSKYKIKLKYGGYFRLIKNSSKNRYCFGSQKCIYIDTCIYDFHDLMEEVATHYPSGRELIFSLYYIDKYAGVQSYIKVDSQDNFQLMLSMYDAEKELTVYVTTDNFEICTMQQRRWQVRGIPCGHAAAFIILTRDANWEIYVDSYFTIERCKLAYALEVAPMPSKDQWVHIETEEKIHPPTIKRPPGRPRKHRIKPHDETTKKQKCKRCGEYGHREKTCKNGENQGQSSSSKAKRAKRA